MRHRLAEVEASRARLVAAAHAERRRLGARWAAAAREPGRRGHDADSEAAVRVLIAEDPVLLREGLVRLFEDRGHTVVGALGDAEGVRAAGSALSRDR